MERGLSAADALWLWECGRDRHPVDRALLMLCASDSEASIERLSRLTIGQRDARLLDLRIATLGERLDGIAECPRCAASLEFSIRAGELRSPGQLQEDNAPIAFEEAGLRLRRPDSRDLARVASLPAGADARRALLQFCVLAADTEGSAVDIDALPMALLEQVSTRISANDPQADISLDLSCAACGHRWPLLFDIAAFFWSEIAALAQRLLREVDALARAYGWHEAEILAMPPARRRLYLEMVA